MRSLKQPCNDENQPISNPNPPFTEFSNGLKCQCKALNFSEEIKVLRDKRAANDAWIARAGMERLQAEAEATKEVHQAEENAHLRRVLASVTDAGFTLYKFLDELMHMRDHTTSLQVLQMLILKGSNLLESICQRQLKIVHAWATKTTGEILACKSAGLQIYRSEE